MSELEWAEKYREHAYHILEEMKRIDKAVVKLSDKTGKHETELAVLKTKVAIYSGIIAAGVSALFKWGF